MTGRHVLFIDTLPPIHKDPCDRIVIATAMLKKLGIVTSDKIFREYKNIKVIW